MGPDEAARPAEPERRLRPLGFAKAALALLPVFLLMSTDGHFWFSVPLGALSCSLAAWFVFDALGTFDGGLAPSPAQPQAVRLRALAPRLVELAGSAMALVVALRLAVAGTLPFPIATAAVLVTAGVLWITFAGYRVLDALSGFALSADRPLHERHGFWLLVANTLLYVPLLGSFSLSDPWETHYGEVAREMLARDDWISLWWAQDGFFWSKPVLDFWLQGLSFSLLGVPFMPDQMLSGASLGRFPQPEWAARLPVFVLSCIASYVLYRGVAIAFGRRAGLIGALVLLATPYWYLLTRQSMTDMPYVAPLATALGLVMLGLGTDPERRARVFPLAIGRRTYELSAYHAVFGLIVVSVLPQLLYLASRHLTLALFAEPYDVRLHLDEFMAGSGGGNCGLPGNDPCRSARPLDRLFQPGLGALVWAAVLALLLWVNRDERRVQRLFFVLAWYFVALSAMAKGAPGLVLPVVITGVAVGAARRFRDFGRLELPALVLIVACVALPWYVQAFARHGSPFIERLFIHDMYKRAFVHVHDTNAGDDTSFRYYVWQLGYGLFPWTGLCAGGLLFWQRHGDEAKSHKAQTLALLALWFVVVFGMFSVTKTKFHHYILPAVPPLAMLGGIVLDRTLGRFEASSRERAAYLGLLFASALSFVGALLLLFPGSALGDASSKEAGTWTWAGAALALGVAVGALVLALRRARSPSSIEDGAEAAFDAWAISLLGFFGALWVLLAGRDLFSTVELNGSSRLMHLLTYNYKRPWPTGLDFGTALKAFTVAAALASAALCLPRFRRHAAVLSLAIGLLWAAWGVNVYFYRLAPHWGQRETILEYYRRRSGPEEPLVAYQMNWKGENFYTGNRLPVFVQSGAKFKTWLGEQRAKGVRVLFFSTEHSRLGSLKNELGSVKKFETLTTPALNNKFFVARVEL